jgi:predicted dehydrogenase
MVGKETIKIGLIGAGTVADYGHLPAINRLPDLELAMIADISRANLRRAREKFGVKGTLDYTKLLEKSDIDAVSICTPVETHRRIAEDALASGKHVLCEKPLASTAEDCWELVKAVQASDSVFAVDLHLRLSEDMMAAKDHIDAGRIGKLEVLRFIMNWGAHGTRGEKGERRAAFMRTGGPMLDNGVHFFDLMYWLSGSEIESMVVEGQWVEEEYEYPGHVISISRLKSGVLTIHEMSFVYGHTTKDLPASSRIEIIGDDGVISGGNLYTSEGTQSLPVGGRKRFDRVYAEFARCIRSGSQMDSPLATAEDGARATEASLRANQLAMEGRNA